MMNDTNYFLEAEVVLQAVVIHPRALNREMSRIADRMTARIRTLIVTRRRRASSLRLLLFFQDRFINFFEVN
jgi:hypothetical protein